MTRRGNFKKLITMYNFSELNTLTNRLIDEEIGTYDLPYYIEPLLEGATLIDLLKYTR